MKRFCLSVFSVLLLNQLVAIAGQAKGKSSDKLTPDTFSGLTLRSIGPALMSGRIVDVVKDPTDRSVWYVTAASGNVWKTTNNGTTWTPIFDHYGSYSIGCISLDPRNPQVVWVGTGENNSQRSTGFGDGVYKSIDGGASWTHMGLKRSEHIGKILIDPRDSNVIFVASQGPLWAPGGDRGLYKSQDGGKTWQLVLEISKNTGVSDIAFDPRNPNIIYAASYQRRRHVGILVAGGPESAIYKSHDGGKHWQKLTRGLPDGDIGRIGITVSPIKPDVVYAQIAAAENKSGFFRSTDGGQTWEKRSDTICIDPQYYMELFPDPHRFDRVYVMDVWMKVTDDGGLNFRTVGSKHKHADNHALVFDPNDPNYLMSGNDGGIYESWDRGETWRFISNLPITQFYKVGLDNALPFYNLYGGTQDNATQGGPSRTHNVQGIRNQDWFNTVGGDGFQPRIDPEDPNIIYTQCQYAGLVRFDKKSGEMVDIQPQPKEGEPRLKWNWDTPLLLSPHSHTRLYYGANRLFRSDDRGDTWVPISGDLTHGIDRNKRKVMGKIWSVDAVWKNVFTSPYGNLVAIEESPRQEGLIYAGTDDGLIHVTEDGGQHWRKISRFPGVPERTYVADLLASRHDPNTVYAVFNNHKEGDFRPYVLKSESRGKNWEPISGRLPDRHVAWSIVEDHVNPNLLFVGTEFGLFFTIDGGQQWIQLKGGLPVIQFRDLEIQRRENDLVAATFGRGFYILDDYTPLRHITKALLEKEAHLFPVKNTWMYIEAKPLVWGKKGTQGHAYYTAPNPPFGAVFTYYVKDEYKTRKKRRQAIEKALDKAGKPIRYPHWDELRKEDREDAPTMVLTVRDEAKNVVRRIFGPVTAGMHRVAWDLRYPSFRPAKLGSKTSGPLTVPGTYTVSLAKRIDGSLTPLGEPQRFKVVPLGLASLPSADKAALLAFQKKTGRLLRAVLGTVEVTRQTLKQLKIFKQALRDTPGADPKWGAQARRLENRLLDLQLELVGAQTIFEPAEALKPSIMERLGRVVRAHLSSTSAATKTHQQSYEITAKSFARILEQLRNLVEKDFRQLQEAMEAVYAPWTSGRGVPKWRPE